MSGGPAASPVTYVHTDFLHVGGAEVLAARQLALLRDADVPVRLVTDGIAWDAWRDALDGVDVRVTGAPDRAGERALAPVLRRAPRWRLARLAARMRPAVLGSRCVVAINYPASAAIEAIAPALPRAWHCNEPPRHLYFPEVTPWAVERLRARGPGTSEALGWTMRMLARHERRARRWPMSAEVALDRERIARMPRVVAISAYTSDALRCAYGRAADALVPPVIPEVPAGRARAGVDGAALQVLAHSRLEHLKNVDGVLRGFAAFVRARPGAHRLHVVGDGSALPRLREVAASLGLGDAVRFHGFLPARELAAVYDACDVLAVLPLDEPFGMVFAEAALRGLLVVGPDHGGPLEILDDGRLGWCVDPLAPAALADALSEVAGLSVTDAERRRARLAEACRSRYGAAAVLPSLRAALRV